MYGVCILKYYSVYTLKHYSVCTLKHYSQKCVKARALYDNIAEAPDELAFRKGDVLTVLEQNTAGLEGWWLCALRGRQKGRLHFLVGTVASGPFSETNRTVSLITYLYISIRHPSEYYLIRIGILDCQSCLIVCLDIMSIELCTSHKLRDFATSFRLEWGEIFLEIIGTLSFMHVAQLIAD
ncbi:Breast cancer anti-estrogen resistance protein 1 [Melipona quadrifasciata]|uniref:Breast cancer anti-estrogen resistance protein 1 n=1 Tax=Melipona quadrifasciata TaxID=166423 RepID=A0A0M9A6I3_9HYME|nr:Breast cancer anti-estrogen resistance protein 1 [Melipona quadrifasciata]